MPEPPRPVALVTGGRRGIGRAVAEHLAEAGFAVAISDLVVDAEAAAARAAIEAKGAPAHAVAGDVADLADHARVLDEVEAALGPIACLVGNAGIAAPVRGDLLDLEPAHYDRVMTVNLKGPFFLATAVARRMLARPAPAGPRTIVLVSSVSAALASPERAEYCLSKAGLAMAARLLALRLAEAGIAVFEVRPGIVRTAMTAAVAERYDARIAAGLVPMRRWGTPEDVGRAVAALAGGAFAFATGAVLPLDGGLSIERL
jgi:NAD(P)-dependent dehydrogenase (short-subunit alcohol dehydrogenase family)